MYFAVYVLMLLLSTAVGSPVAKGCSISIRQDLTDPQPLLLYVDSGSSAYEAVILPNHEGIIDFETAEYFTLACPGGSLKINNETIKSAEERIDCNSGTSFTIDDQTVDFKAIACTRHTKHSARFTGKACLKKYKEAEIGFELSDGSFVAHITVCFDEEEQNTLYSVYNLASTIDGYQIDYPRVEFIEGTFYNLGGVKVNDLYNRNTQRVTINNMLGLAADDKTYIHGTNDYYLARGHLTAKTDFTYGSQQRLTFYYINAAPQWQTHNAGNWLALENSVRAYSTSNELDLLVYTGTHGVATLPHAKTGEDVELYLYDDDENGKAVPVPELFWKVLYDPESKAGVAFVGVNNPYDEEPQAICKNVCDKIDWLSWKPTDIKNGYSYCCEVKEFRKVVKTLPTFTVSGLLK